MAYYTPPPSANGPNWTHSGHPQHQGHNHLTSPSHPNAQQPNANPMFAMMAMMQQMQGYPSQTYPQQYAQSQMQSPVVESQRMHIPQVGDNSLIAQILYEQTKRGLTYKAALESLHGVCALDFLEMHTSDFARKAQWYCSLRMERPFS